MDKKNSVFIATSIDGYIDDRNGGLGWLELVPNPEHNDMGYNSFIENIDAIVMGRTTFELVCSFDCDWPYSKPVFVLSGKLKSLPEEYSGKAVIVNGSLLEVLDGIHQKGFNRLYIDGGKTIQSFLKEDLIDELIITTIPVLLGGGTPLFTALPKELNFELLGSEIYLEQIVQRRYSRINLNPRETLEG